MKFFLTLSNQIKIISILFQIYIYIYIYIYLFIIIIIIIKTPTLGLGLELFYRAYNFVRLSKNGNSLFN